jgi:pyrroline-5-carboxylate reductase
MSGAMVEGWRLAGLDLSNAVAIRPSGRPVEGLRVVTNFADAGLPPRLVILGVKPQQLDEVGPKLAGWVTSKTTLVSILAGVEAKSLRERFPKAGAIVRAIPNLPVSIRRGVIGLYSDEVSEELGFELSQLFAMLGYAMWSSSESALAAIGSVAGAGPAYVARFIDALAKAGVDRGLTPELAQTVALETVLGTSWMAATTQESMDEIVRRVASPNGTTEAGLAVLSRDDVFDKLITLTISAASRRGAELAEEARRTSLLAEPQGTA